MTKKEKTQELKNKPSKKINKKAKNSARKKIDKVKDKITEIHHHYNNENGNGFNFGKIILGLVIIAIGFFYLAKNMGFIPDIIDLNLYKLWPIIIILWGLSLLKIRGVFGFIVGLISSIAILSLITVMVLSGSNISINQISNIDIDVPKQESTSKAKLNIENASGKIFISSLIDEDDTLIKGDIKTILDNIEREEIIENDIQKVSLHFQNKIKNIIDSQKNDINLSLSPDTKFDLYINSKTAELNLDLSSIILDDIQLDTDASTLDLKLGDKSKNYNVDINSDASSILLRLPETMGAQITLDSDLSSKSLDNFIEFDENIYHSKNYDSAANKIELNLNLDLSTLEVLWF